MGERDVRNQNIEKLLTHLTRPEGIRVEEALESLCMYFRPHDIGLIYNTLSERGDTQSIYWLVRYLVSIERVAGFEKLFQLADSDKEFIRDSADNGIAKMNKTARVKLSFKMLDMKWVDQVCFAIEELGKLTVANAIVPIFEVLKKHDMHEDVYVSVVRALGHIGGRRAFNFLEQTANNEHGQVQEEAITSLRRLIRTFRPVSFKRYLSSDNPGIREIAYRIAASSLKRRGEHCLAQGLRNEWDETTKIRILSWVRSVRTRSLFQSVFGMALNDSSAKVNMMAYSVLKRIRSKAVLKHIIRQEAISTGKAKILLLRFLSGYSASSTVTDIFIKNYKSREEDLVRLISVESLGRMNNKKAMMFLGRIVRQKDIYSYAAAIALSQMIDGTQWDIIDEMLSLDEKTSSGVIQVFLRLIINLPFDHKIPDMIKDDIEKLTIVGSPQTRYLAVRCSVRSAKKGTVKQLLRGSRDDSSLNVKGAYIKSLLEMLQYNPMYLLELLEEFTKDGRIYTLCYRLFREVQNTQEDFVKIATKILNLLCEIDAEDSPDKMFYTGRLMVFLRVMATKNKAFFLEYLEWVIPDDTRRWYIMRVINATDIHQFRGISVDFMAEQYSTADARTKVEYLKFFKQMCVYSKVIEKEVFDDLAVEEDEEVCKWINVAVSDWMATSAERQCKI